MLCLIIVYGSLANIHIHGKCGHTRLSRIVVILNILLIAPVVLQGFMGFFMHF